MGGAIAMSFGNKIFAAAPGGDRLMIDIEIGR